MVKTIFISFLLLFFIGNVMAIEQAKYTVVLKSSAFELRQYEPQIVAGTIVEGEFEQVGNIAFRRLFNYISGSNRKKETIPMTAPVTQETQSEKIDMTAPVNQEKRDGKWWVTFLMPAEFTLKTLPEPLDPKVELKEIPGRTMAVIKYSGTWNKKRYDEKEILLRNWIQKQQWKIVGEPVFARYDPPFKPWFLRRNEILIPVEPKMK
jgi:hypothetical protein